MDYHKRIRLKLMQMESDLSELSELESPNRQSWIGLLKKFQSIADDLAMHMIKEEAFVISYIEQLEIARTKGTDIPTAKFPNLQVPLEFIKLEHEEIFDKLIGFQSATNELKLAGFDSKSKAQANKVMLSIQQFQALISLAMDFETQELFKEAINLENDLNDNH